MPNIVYGDKPETILRAQPRARAKSVNHVLLGSRLMVTETADGWLKVEPGWGKVGWVRAQHVRSNPALKIFYVDVGQGDGCIVESPEGVMLIDGGPSKNYYGFLRHRYRSILNAGEKVHINAVVVSHPDMDHYAGLTHVLNDKAFTFGTIFHNGIIRYDKKKPSGKPFDLGTLRDKRVNGVLREVLTETFSTLDQAMDLKQTDLMSTFRKFWVAARKARHQGRLKSAKRITIRNGTLPGYGGPANKGLRVEILGPLPTTMDGRVEYVGFADPGHPNSASSSSHTRNGHSIVLKLLYGDHTFLFGGDLNIPAEAHLMDHYKNSNPFRVDVAKACHHGSSDFSVEFLKLVRPLVNVISSGDNKSFDHPTADALGASGRHTRGDHPLLYSTELARAYGKKRIHYGLINARSNGKVLVMAQMKEQHRNKGDVWDSFTVPWHGKFSGH